MMSGRHASRQALVNENNTRMLRDGLGKFATGVTVVTCQGHTGPIGITANSFSSVSLEPPLILWNISKQSRSLQAFLQAQHFAVNVLASRQEPLSVHFAQTDRPSFDSVAHDMSSNGVPLLSEVLACFECRTHEIHECGDHHIIIGEVEDYRVEDGEPLLFFSGRYTTTANRR
jgi:flavin reductase (DIM6/NTAB) family NADH-FMN oxidoreductase RutF